MRLTKSQIATLEKTIDRLEAHTCAEVVLVIKDFSGTYQDLHYLAGLATTLLSVIGLHASTRPLSATAVVLTQLFAFILGVGLAKLFRFEKILATRKRKRLQVEKSAHRQFYEKQIHTARANAGILLYYSITERSGLMLADEGARNAIGPHWDRYSRQFNRACRPRLRKNAAKHLAEFFGTFGVFLGQVLPPTNEVSRLSNLPDFGSESGDSNDT